MRTLLIAEAGVNHNGSLDAALKLVDVAAEAGADVVKFQSFRAQNLVTTTAPKAEYQFKKDRTNSQREMLRQLELSFADFQKVKEHCAHRKIRFLSSPFDLESFDFLTRELGMREIKIASGEITNGPLLWKAARACKKIFLSTGASDEEDVENALKVIAHAKSHAEEPRSFAEVRAVDLSAHHALLCKEVELLHCVSEYPAPIEEIRLLSMLYLAKRFRIPTGYSDHTLGLDAALAATAMGACVIEKHFTLDKTQAGPDHAASLDPNELCELAQKMRIYEALRGDFDGKTVAPSERKNRPLIRKGLYAQKEIQKGDSLDYENISFKRPENKKTPMHFWDLQRQAASRTYRFEEALDE